MSTITAFRARRLAMFRATAESSMMDAGHVGAAQTPTGGNPNSGIPVDPDDYGAEIACGFRAAKQSERSDGSQIAETSDTIRVPIGTTIARGDRFKLTKRHGVSLAAAEIYSITGLASRGISAKVMLVELVTGKAVA